MNISGKRILVTGSSGFIGGLIFRKLYNTQANVVIGIDKNNVHSDSGRISADLSDKDCIEIIRSFNPEIIIHAAAQSDVMSSLMNPIEDLKSNVISTLNIIKAIDDLDCECIVYLNSGGATYMEAPSPRFESDPIKPQSPYGISKQTSELYLEMLSLQSDRRFVSLALSNVYGELQDNKKGVIFNFVEAMKSGREIKIFGEKCTRDYVHVDDVVDSILIALEKDIVGRYNISTGIPTENMQIFYLVADALNFKLEPKIYPSRRGEMFYSVLSNIKFREATGWEPKIQLKDGISRILESE